MSFEALGLSRPLTTALFEKGYQQPTPIQERSIPIILKKKDLMACAQTGTGKTASFTLPLLDLLKNNHQVGSKFPRALILAPTRELSAQIKESLLAYGKNLSLKTALVFGGVKINPQIAILREGVDILVATPGRLLDLFQQGAVTLNKVEILVLDEADRMLDMGFIRDIKKIISYLPSNRQNLLFSATFSNEIRQLGKSLLKNPLEVNVAPQVVTAKTVKHKIHPVDKAKKSQLLSYLIQSKNWYQALVFCKTKHGANNLVKKLSQDNIPALAIHGNKSQSARTKALEAFKQGKLQILVATDIAARGLDIEQLAQVVNYDLPSVPEDYVHRIGRTGRAGASGNAISLVCADEIKELLSIEKVIKQTIKREEVEGFEPKHNLPIAMPRNVQNSNSKPKFTPKSKTTLKPKVTQKPKGKKRVFSR
ncbi:MAG: DEAD/DEAH box helicase [Flavobacteriales bacterium]|nr:DEAD/DEAH box helicase [Flavobacteriales bacterium]